jgi:salicylate hydroxylase
MGNSDVDVRTIYIGIIGGGVAGLSLAAGLIKIPHIKVVIFEAVKEYDNVGAGFALHKNATEAMACIGQEVLEAYFDKATAIGEADDAIATHVIVAQGPHAGEKVAELGKTRGRKTLSHADLLNAFRSLLPDDCIAFGKRLRTCIDLGTPQNDRLLLIFEDESVEKVDCVLGADGINSVVRAHVLGEADPAVKPRNHDRWRIYCAMVPTEKARKEINPTWTENMPILLGPRGHISCIPLNENTRVSAGVAVRGVAKVPEVSPLPPLDPSLYQDYLENAQEIVRMVAKDSKHSWAASDHDEARTYCKGRVAILGDAAHAALPFAGNGVAQALEDAAVLSVLFRAIKRHEQINTALRAYCRTRIGRSQAVVRLSRQFGRVL